MDKHESRMHTLCLSCFSFVSIVFFVFVYVPSAQSAPPHASMRPMTIVSLIAAVFATAGWIPAVVIGIRQLFWKPRVYGLLSIGVAVAHCVSFRAAQWLLIDVRGIQWGT